MSVLYMCAFVWKWRVRPQISNNLSHEKNILCCCIYVCNFMFLFVRSMAFWQWTSALSYWNSCSLSSWNAPLEVRDCFPFASLCCTTCVWLCLGCLSFCLHINTNPHTNTPACMHFFVFFCFYKAIWWWCWSVEIFLKICLNDIKIKMQS